MVLCVFERKEGALCICCTFTIYYNEPPTGPQGTYLIIIIIIIIKIIIIKIPNILSLLHPLVQSRT